MLTESQRAALIEIGVALLAIQTTEKLIKLCLQLVIQRPGIPLTLAALEAQDKEERRKTLGYFLSELRKRAKLDEEFDETLRQFLSDRNDFVHDLTGAVGTGLTDAHGPKLTRDFVARMLNSATYVMHVFAGLLRAWEDQIGAPLGDYHGEDFMKEIDRLYKPMADQIFLRKED